MLASVSLLADGWHHGHWWIVFPILWLLLIAAVIALFWRRGPNSGGTGSRGTGSRGSDDSPQRILAERFARGEIGAEEYRERLAQLQ
jgi:putative membrane protein